MHAETKKLCLNESWSNLYIEMPARALKVSYLFQFMSAKHDRKQLTATFADTFYDYVDCC